MSKLRCRGFWILGVLVFLAVSIVPAGSGGSVDLLVHPEGAPLEGAWQVTVGVPFPKGELKDARLVRLLSPSGKEIPVQVRKTCTWLDGSIKWCLLDFDAELKGDSEPLRYRLEYGSGAKAPPHPHPIRLYERGDSFLVDNRKLKVMLSKAGFDLRIVRDGRAVSHREGSIDFYMVDHLGEMYSFALDREASVTIEDRGPQRVAVKIEGWNISAEGKKLGRNVVRLYIYAGKPYLRVFHTFIITADTDRVRYRDIGMRLPFRARKLSFPGTDDTVRGARDGGAYLLQWQNDSFEIIEGGRVVKKGKRAEGIVTLLNEEEGLTLSVRDFWQNFPKELEVEGRSLTVHFWPRHNKPPLHTGDKLTWKNMVFLPFVHEGELLDFRIPGEYYQKFITSYKHDNVLHSIGSNAMGLAKTHEILVHFHEPERLREAEKVARTFVAWPVVSPEPVHMCASGAFGRIAPKGTGPYQIVEEAIEQQFDWTVRMRELTGDYGMFNYGDYHYRWIESEKRWSPHRHYAGWHHGGPRVPWLMFARSGEPRFFKFAYRETRHHIDVDMCHWATPEFGERTKALLELAKKEGVGMVLRPPGKLTPEEELELRARVKTIEATYPREKLLHELAKYRQKRVGGICMYKGYVHWYCGSRAYHSSMADFMLWGYYLSGDRRMWDCAMEFGKALREIGGEYRGRAGAARGCAAVSLYQATHNRKYLELARRQMKYSLSESKTGASIGNFYYAPFAERWYEMTEDPELAKRWSIWAELLLKRGGLWWARDAHYEKLAYGYLLTGRAEFLQYGLDQLRFYISSLFRGEPPHWHGSGLQGINSYTIQQWGLFLYALREHYRKTGKWMPLPELPDSRLTRFRLFAFDDPTVIVVHKSKDESVDVPITCYANAGIAVTVTAPDGGRLIEEKLIPKDVIGDSKGAKIRVALRLSAKDAPGDYRIEMRWLGKRGSKKEFLVPFPGKYSKLVMRLPLDLYQGGRMYFLPLSADGRQPWFAFSMRGRRVNQFCSLIGPDGKQKAYAENDGGLLWLTHRPEPSLTEKPWLFFKGFGSNMITTAVGDVLPYISFRREHFFIPKACRKFLSERSVLLWHFDEVDGQIASDAIGFYDGQLGSLSQPDQNDPERIADGYLGGALRFNGNSFVRLPSVDRSPPRLVGLEELTAEAFIRVRGGTIPGAVISMNNAFSLSAGSMSVQASLRARQSASIRATANGLADGGWHHIALSYDGKLMRVFVDGKVVGTSKRAEGRLYADWWGPLYVGRGFLGDIDEVRISHWCRYMEEFTVRPPEEKDKIQR